jgi:HTH-type transcriptional regulator, competence development regulator
MMAKTSVPPLLADVGGRLRQARLAQGMNLHQLARLTGISAPALSLIETGKRDPRLSTLDRLATALRLPLADLVAERALANPPATGEGYDLGDYE